MKAEVSSGTSTTMVKLPSAKCTRMKSLKLNALAVTIWVKFTITT